MIYTFLAEAPRFYSYYNLVFLGQAALNTLMVSFLGCLIGYAAGFVLALLRQGRLVPWGIPRGASWCWTELFRRIPFLVLLMCVFFGFQLSGAEASLAVVAVTAVALRMSALAAENIRAGLESVPGRQWEAALTMNISPLATLFRIVLPQAWKVILPPSTIHTVSMIKETALVSQIGFLELTFAARMLTQRGFSAFICYGTILVVYFLISWGFSSLGRLAERRLVHQARAGRTPAPLSAAALRGATT